ncbi:MAG TPA: CRISPR-associated protein Cas4 [Elusimicrobia bacterium]|nr:CRISPR-associated protein Cas4 [Elusimicrobiota bacterium]
MEPILLSAINQYFFCPRRCGLIHVDGVFVNNAYTLEGSFLHDKVDTPGVENRAGVRIVRALPLYSREMGLNGKADIVEFYKQPDGTEVPLPVDYKRGPRRKWANDDAQLCAQALCLEEMIGVPVPKGAIFHAASKKRREVLFDAVLRGATLETINKIRAMLETGKVPPPLPGPRCEGCSLKNICMPEIVSAPGKVVNYNINVFNRN